MSWKVLHKFSTGSLHPNVWFFFFFSVLLVILLFFVTTVPLINWNDFLFLSSRAWWRHQQRRDTAATAEEEGSGRSHCGECTWPQPLSLTQCAHCRRFHLVVFSPLSFINFPHSSFVFLSALPQQNYWKTDWLKTFLLPRLQERVARWIPAARHCSNQ